MALHIEVWRTGSKTGRILLRQLGPEPSDDDPVVGVMVADTPEEAAKLAQLVVGAVNGLPLWAER